MPSNRRYRVRVYQAPTDLVHWAMLSDTPIPTDANPFTLIQGRKYNFMRDLWNEHRETILASWVLTNPGTRPSMWWRYDAPRASAATAGKFAGTPTGERMIEPRALLTGEGKPLHEASNHGPAYWYGIPTWCGSLDAPPTFETQHAYLKRHGLLQPGEHKPRTEPFPQPRRLERTTSRQVHAAADRP